MAEKSKIEWTDASWTPVRARNLKTGKIGWHCEHATTGCINCYSESKNKWLGTGLPFKPGHRKDIEIFLDEKMLVAPLRWKKPRMIFVCSMTDAFADFVKDEWLDKMFAVMALCPQHTFQVLTKRAERMRKYFAALAADDYRLLTDRLAERLGEIGHDAFHKAMTLDAFADKYCNSINPDDGNWPLSNVWLGVSAERQQEADERIPHLLQTPAAVRFVSAEPLLGPIDFGRIAAPSSLGGTEPSLCQLDWIIVGGESGPGARPFHLEHADAIVEQCAAAGVACFVKQLGAVPISDGYPLELRDRKGGDINEWPDRLKVRQMPSARER